MSASHLDGKIVAARMLQDQRWGFVAGEVVISPLAKGSEHRAQRQPERGQVILETSRPLAILVAFDEALVFQSTKPGREDIAWSPGVLDDIRETVTTEEEFPKRQQRPLLADHIERTCYRALPYSFECRVMSHAHMLSSWRFQRSLGWCGETHRNRKLDIPTHYVTVDSSSIPWSTVELPAFQRPKG